MDTYFDDIYVSLFYQWILRHDYNEFSIEEHQGYAKEIILTSSNAIGTVAFNKYNIIELKVENKVTKENTFYLHFQMNNLNHAMELYHEMVKCMLEMDTKPSIKILLCCSGGLTTSYFAEKMNQAAELLSLNYEINAIGYERVFAAGNHYDVILLAPQISYHFSELKKVFIKKLVLKIPPRIFAAYNVKEMFELITSETLKKKIKDSNQPTVKATRQISHQIISISLFRDHHRIHLKYAVFAQDGKVLDTKEVVKNEFNITDLYDVIDTSLLHYPNIEAIGLAIPGIIKGTSQISSTGIKGLSNINFGELIQRRYNQLFMLYNDANAAAVGYYAMQSQYDSLVCLFQPAMSSSGAGIIMNGELIHGKGNIAGEMQYLPFYDDHARETLVTKEGMIEVVSKTIRSIISVIGPEAIILYCSMIPDLEPLQESLKASIPEEFLPEIIKITTLEQYIIIGVAIAMSKVLESSTL